MIRRSAPASSPHPCVVAAILLASTTPLSGQVPDDDLVEIPAVFEADRIYVRPVTTTGDTLVFYTDTGGGANMLYAPTVERLDPPRERMPANGDSVTTVPWPDWNPEASIPRPARSTGPMGERLLVVPFEGHAAMMQDATDAGFLGRLWFADRTWTFDYPAEELLLRPPGDLPAHEGAQRTDLGFQTDSAGRRTTHFPRIQVVIDGDTFDVLFDTGATMVLTAEALEAIGDGGPSRRAASFISAAVFDAWRSEHPDWRVIERATGMEADLIEVPRVEIAGTGSGPVWFERRDTGTFEDGMSRWMDRSIVGALGGNALRAFRVTVDYPGAVAVFER